MPRVWKFQHSQNSEGSTRGIKPPSRKRRHGLRDRDMAFKRASESEKLPCGIFFLDDSRPTFEENLGIYAQNHEPLFKREVDLPRLQELVNRFCPGT